MNNPGHDFGLLTVKTRPRRVEAINRLDLSRPVMTRKNESGSGPSPGRALASLKSLRTQIDKLDLQILKLVNERAQLASEIGKIKNENGGEIFSPAREEEVLQNVLQANKGPLDDATI